VVANEVESGEAAVVAAAAAAARRKTCYNCGGLATLHAIAPANGGGEDRQVINKARSQYRCCFNCGRWDTSVPGCRKLETRLATTARTKIFARGYPT
jgi:hypothetical protein